MLRINLERSSFACFGEVGAKHIMQQGHTLHAQAKGTADSDRVAHWSQAEILGALMERARKSFRPRW